MNNKSQISLQPKKVLIIALTLILIFPSWAIAENVNNGNDINSFETNADIKALAEINIYHNSDLSSGWNLGTIDDNENIMLRFRNADPINTNQWSNLFGDIVDGWHILQHTMPVPSEWLGELSNAGIECHSYIPNGAFHCLVQSKTIPELENLEVQGIMVFDPTDKVHPMVDELLANEFEDGFYFNGKGIFTTVLSGDSVPELQLDDSLILLSHSNRWATFLADETGISQLANNPGIQWIEPKFKFNIQNSIGRDIIEVDYVSQTAEMTLLNPTWAGLTGSGVQVTVADSGLDSGVNDGTMHPDFQGRITAIESLPIPQWWLDVGLLDASASLDDGAADISNCVNCGNGHGTHVAGSVLGDGTSSGGSIIGAAPAATLHFQATEQWADYSAASGKTDYYGLYGIPDDLNTMFAQAYENGSRVHTNSWGASIAGQYDASAQQADNAAYTYKDMVILFAAANDGVDVNNDGEVDEDSLGSPGTAKNVITVGASENDRSSLPTDSGSFVPGAWGAGSVSYAEPIHSDLTGGEPEGMAAFSSRGPTDDDRQKPEVTAPGTWILSTRSRSTAAGGWLAYDSDHVYMGGTSMATPLTAGSTALLLEHLNSNLGVSNPSSALVTSLFVVGADDMIGQYGDPNNGAGEAIPNYHEGWGRIDLGGSINSSFVDGETVNTGEFREFSFNVPASLSTLKVALSYTDTMGDPAFSVQLNNDLDIELFKPDGTSVPLANNLDTTKGITINSPQSGTWEVHVTGTNVPIGPQPFAIAVNVNSGLTNSTNDLDGDGVDDTAIDDCLGVWGNSTNDRQGCIDSDGDGYSDPDGSWTIAQGADAFISDSTQWADSDLDGFGDNPSGNNPDDCIMSQGTSMIDRKGCPDLDGDGFSNPDGSWTTGHGADACIALVGDSTVDRSGCPDFDGDGYSDPDGSWTIAQGADEFIGDPEQWVDSDGDGYGDNPPPANLGDSCPLISGTSSNDRKGCADSDGDGYSDPDVNVLAHPLGVADAFPADSTQWRDTDGDGYGDNSGGTDPDSCPLVFGTSTQNNILGCLDSDSDGYDDSSDPIPNDGTQWEDSDEDGYGDNAGGNNPDLWPSDPSQAVDTDGDGYGDNSSGTNGDAFPNDATQWEDSDEDGYGDNAGGNYADDCPSIFGTSNQNNYYGCLDNDGDGFADTVDDFPYESTQWIDTDGDGYGDNSNGAKPDSCPNVAGNSSKNFKWGCTDSDGDGYADIDDALQNLAGQWEDADADGYGDDPNGPQFDSCKYEPGTSWIDRYGCKDSDNDGYSDLNDHFPNDVLRHLDVDNDGFDDLSEDACDDIFGTSSIDRKGCIDTDGDGYSDPDIFYTVADGADAYPTEPTQWNDTDGDGYGDNSAPAILPDDCPNTAGNSSFILLGCIDIDGDGYPNSNDSLPQNPTQWADSDGDGYGDNPLGTEYDECTDSFGNSSMIIFGCLDTDRDGSPDSIDPLPEDSSQWVDSDGDGYGDNPGGTDPDYCPDIFGTSSLGSESGCLDSDGDGYSDNLDAFPNVYSQWEDSDGDGYGDNNSLDATWIDYWPQDDSKNTPTSSIVCTTELAQIVVDPSGIINGKCTVTNSMNKAIRIIINLDLNPGLESSQKTWYLELQAAGSLDATKEIEFDIIIGAAGEWNATFEILAIGSNELIISEIITFAGYVSENEIPKESVEELSSLESIVEMLGPVGPHATPMSLFVISAIFILLQSGKIWNSRRKQRKVKEEFIKNRIRERTRPPLPNNSRNNNSQIKSNHNRSDVMRRLTNNSTQQRIENNNDYLLDDLI
ncbi:MAG: hypothetical protein CMA27_03755 [Euryarchaeota archaeon]|nr:hypothetical protein [Euryarchaeota archaeon]